MTDIVFTMTLITTDDKYSAESVESVFSRLNSGVFAAYIGLTAEQVLPLATQPSTSIAPSHNAYTSISR